MRVHSLFAVVFWVLVAGAVPIGAQETETEARAAEGDGTQAEGPRIPWQMGAGTTPIGDALAEIDLSDQFVFLDADGTRQFMELLENPVSGNELATISPRADEENWFVVFEFDEIGYIENAEEEELDADALLESFRQGTEAGNEERRKRGWAEMQIVGWHEPPRYDSRTQNLTWSIIGRSGDHDVINRNTRLLGRRGVMSAVLVCDRAQLDAASAVVDTLLGGYRYTQGSRYADFVPGTDTIAKVGLAGLITGGAAVGLAKAGLLQKFWKVIVVGAAGLVAGIKRLFGRGKRSETAA